MSTIKKALSKLIQPMLREARVERVTDVAKRFRRIDLEGDALRGPRCAAGDKLQVMVDGDFRTYTPFAFDGAAGRLSLLAFLHESGPGARWAGAVEAGARVHVFGPRGSVPLAELPSPVVLVGDETSIAVGRALDELGKGGAVVFEVEDVDAARAAAEAIGLGGARFVARFDGEGHVETLWSAVKDALKPTGSLVLTGKAQTIQSLRSLSRRDATGLTQKNKAYWAPGKRGLD